MKHLLLIGIFLTSGCGSTGALTPEAAVPTAHTAGAVGAPARLNAPFRKATLDIDAWSQRFEGESREVYRAREAIVEVLGLEPGQVVADVGAGTGLFVAYLSQAVGSEGRVIAVDISPAFVAHIQARADAAGLTNVTSQLGERADVRLPAGGVDLIFTCDTYHHFEDTAQILATMRQALKPDGRFVVVDYHRIPGKTRPFLMEHVRANQAVFAAEIEAAGFTRLPDPPAPFLDENYLMVFQR
ncbi:MAG: class I SAM-dependent methyltransferase [Myxococcota bacterium]